MREGRRPCKAMRFPLVCRMRFGRPFFTNCSVLMSRADSFELVAFEGSANRDRRKKLIVPIEEQNIIQSILTTKRYHLGTLPPNPENFRILEQFDEDPSSMFLVLPLIYNQRVEFILFASAPTPLFTLDCVRLFQLMMEKASLTHQILLLQNRLRLLPDDLN